MRRPTGGLWSHRDFVKLWTGQSISELGSVVSGLAIPLLAAFNLHASPFQFSLLGVMGFLPFILFALPAGVWVDRLRRRYILIVGDATRAVLLALIPILWALHDLQVWHLLVLEFVIGIFTVFFDVAYQSYLPALIEREHLIDGNSKLQLTASVSQISGPPIAGALMAAIGAANAILADCASFVVSTVFMLSMRHRESPPKPEPGQEHPKMWPQVKEGLNWVVRHPWLRSIAMCTGTSNFFSTLSNAILILYMARTLHLSKLEIPIVFVASPAGSIAAGLFTSRVNRRIGVGPTILATIATSSVAGLCYPLAPHSFPLPLLMVGGALFGFGAVAYNITQVSLRQAITPERLQGRMNAAMRWIVWGTIPLGTLLGGGVATWFGLRTALWVGGIGNTLAILPIALGSVRKVREMPEPVQEPTPGEAELEGGLLQPQPLPGPAAADL
ncbi:MAG TPA: MFS transporter [Gaiellaceae bacterium]|nr:MFS transporter [Gaiellaceae bacterium]